jgi:hypothetical protein
MSEEFVTYKDFGEFQKNIGSLTAEVGSLKTAIKEQHDSLLPFIKGVNDNIKKLEDEDARLDKRITEEKVKVDMFSFKFFFVLSGIISIISFITNFLADKILVAIK